MFISLKKWQQKEIHHESQTNRKAPKTKANSFVRDPVLKCDTRSEPNGKQSLIKLLLPGVDGVSLYVARKQYHSLAWEGH